MKSCRWIFIFMGITIYMVFHQIVALADEALKSNPEKGIFSNNRVDHQNIRGKMIVADDWVTIENKENLFCKWINERMPIENLKEIIGFEDDNLIPMTKEKRSEYDESSIYFESCNYIDGYRSPIFNWGKDKNILLKWPNTDAYIDTDYSLLLIDYIDNDEKFVRVLFVDKKHQYISNKMAKDSFFEKAIKRMH